MDTETYEKFDEEIHKLARYLCREWPDMEFEDLKQELWVVLLKYHSKGKLTEVDDKYLRTTLRFKGQGICSKSRQDHLIISPQYAYRTKDIRNLFEMFWFYENWIDAEVPKDAVLIPTDAQAKSDEGIHMMSDLSIAFEALNDRYKAIIYREFRDRDELNKADRKVLDNALHRVAEELNTYRGVRG